ncbi:MAG: polyprenyl synthetase family protein, partial [Magnetococcales bacterium]|nr:polyprenyl synthetase family protein [Magnetococcales bacterium]
QLQQAIELLRGKGSLDYAMKRARDFVVEAKESLHLCPEGPEKEALIMIAEFSVDREF